MRLLKLDDHGGLSLTEDLHYNIPAYAILSHTWGSDKDEVTFNDLRHLSFRNKAGYEKIRFCGEQAKRDGLAYFWVDTCCINQADGSEYSDAINSMFRWYRDAAKCYVYLSDVSIAGGDEGAIAPTWEVAFRKSRWFTRGWTLPELLAPTSVEFFSQEGRRLGDKTTLERQIHETTSIPVTALRGALLSQFGVDERMGWAAKRQTRRKEDQAYCLLGIFNINMRLKYGERERALDRFKEEIEKSVKLQTLKVLGSQSPLSDETLSKVVALLEDQDKNVRQTALEVLQGQSLSDSALEKVVAQLEDQDNNVRRAALQVLQGQPLLDSTLEKVVARLEDQYWNIRRAALQVLRDQPSLSDETLKKVIALLEHQYWNVRWTALQVLGSQSPLSDETLSKVVALLEDQDKNVRQTAHEVLQGQSLSDETLGKVVALLEDQDKNVRQSALEVLQDQSSLSDSTLEKLVARLDDQDKDVRQAALQALRSQSPLSDETLRKKVVALLEDQDKNVRQTALEVLRDQSLLSDEILGKVVTRLEDQYWDVRWAALQVLGDQSFLSDETLKKVVARLKHQQGYVRRIALTFLRRQSSLSDESLGQVVARLEDQDKNVRQAAFKVLGSQSPLSDETLRKVVALLELPDEDVRQTALKVLQGQSSLSNETLENLVARLEHHHKEVRLPDDLTNVVQSYDATFTKENPPISETTIINTGLTDVSEYQASQVHKTPQRVTWTCSCGMKLHDYYTELVPGSLVQLQQRLRCENPQSLVSRTSLWRRLVTWATSGPPTGASQINHSRPSSQSQSTKATQETTGNNTSMPRSNDTNTPSVSRGPSTLPGTLITPSSHQQQSIVSYLLLCFPEGLSGVKLYQQQIFLPGSQQGSLNRDTNDKQLFELLRKKYATERRVFMSSFWPKTVIRVSLAYFLVDVSNYVDLRHYACLAGGTDCRCIPPPDMIRPSNGAQYDCIPREPDYKPPVGPNCLTHYFQSPNCIQAENAASAYILNQVPKRLGPCLATSGSERMEAWGLEFEEGWDRGRLRNFIFGLITIGSFTFAIFWSVLKKDIQSAFGIAGFIVATLAIFSGYVASAEPRIVHR